MSVPSDPAIDALYGAWREAIRRQDIDGVLSLLEPDYLLWSPGAAGLTVDALRPRLAAALTAYEIEPSFEREEQIVVGDWAFERGWDVQIVKPRAGGPGQVRRQRVFLILRRGADGQWRFARGMSQPGPTT
jgi:ketosteroid isomerase-like protein